jgi:DNA-binding transcriptional LysR family regulator
MKHLDDPHFFVLLVKEKSMAAAARQLGVTPPAVTQRLQQLEARIGVRLLDRTTRRISLTDEGELYFERASQLATDYDEMIETLRSRRSLVRGRLRVHATLGFGRQYIAPALTRFHSLYPELEIALTLSDRRVTLDAEKVDMIIHIGELPDSSHVAIPLAPNNRILCASPAYVRRRGMPETPESLAEHDCVMLRQNEEDVTMWRFTPAQTRARNKGNKEETAVRIRPILSSNDGDVVRQWALAGKGIMLRSEWDAVAYINAGKLVRLLPDCSLPPANIAILVGEHKRMSARVRLFADLLTAQFKPKPPWR